MNQIETGKRKHDMRIVIEAEKRMQQVEEEGEELPSKETKKSERIERLESTRERMRAFLYRREQRKTGGFVSNEIADKIDKQIAKLNGEINNLLFPSNLKTEKIKTKKKK